MTWAQEREGVTLINMQELGTVETEAEHVVVEMEDVVVVGQEEDVEQGCLLGRAVEWVVSKVTGWVIWPLMSLLSLLSLLLGMQTFPPRVRCSRRCKRAWCAFKIAFMFAEFVMMVLYIVDRNQTFLYQAEHRLADASVNETAIQALTLSRALASRPSSLHYYTVSSADGGNMTLVLNGTGSVLLKIHGSLTDEGTIQDVVRAVEGMEDSDHPDLKRERRGAEGGGEGALNQHLLMDAGRGVGVGDILYVLWVGVPASTVAGLIAVVAVSVAAGIRRAVVEAVEAERRRW